MKKIEPVSRNLDVHSMNSERFNKLSPFAYRHVAITTGLSLENFEEHRERRSFSYRYLVALSLVLGIGEKFDHLYESFDNIGLMIHAQEAIGFERLNEGINLDSYRNSMADIIWSIQKRESTSTYTKEGKPVYEYRELIESKDKFKISLAHNMIIAAALAAKRYDVAIKFVELEATNKDTEHAVLFMQKYRKVFAQMLSRIEN